MHLFCVISLNSFISYSVFIHCSTIDLYCVMFQSVSVTDVLSVQTSVSEIPVTESGIPLEMLVFKYVLMFFFCARKGRGRSSYLIWIIQAPVYQKWDTGACGLVSASFQPRLKCVGMFDPRGFTCHMELR